MSTENTPEEHDDVQDSPAINGMLREMDRGGEGEDENFVQMVMGGLQRGIRPLEPAWAWLGGPAFWKAAAAMLVFSLCALGLYSYTILSRHANPEEVMLYSQSELAPGRNAAFRVFVRDGRTQSPIANAAVMVFLKPESGKKIEIGKVQTDEFGLAACEAVLPEDLPEGDYTVMAVAKTDDGKAKVSKSIAVKRTFKCMLSSDKPLYQPGQTIHIRTLSLSKADLKPVAGRKVIIEVMDAKGNKVFKKIQNSSAFGIAAADFQLADQVNMGTYTLAATIGDSTTEKTVTVKRYTLPKFKIELSTDRSYYKPGDSIKGTLKATYTFGKPVANGRISIEAQEFIHSFQTFSSVTGTTDADGNLPFVLKLKSFFAGSDLNKGNAYISLKATVVDPAKHKLEKTRSLTITNTPILVDVIPEGGELIPNVENQVYVLTTRPDGRPVKTDLIVRVADTMVKATTTDLGLATIKITPKQSNEIQVKASTRQGATVRVTRKVSTGNRDGFLLHTNKAVYKSGDSLELTVRSAVPKTRVFVDVVKDQRTELMTAIDVKDGIGNAVIDLDPGVFGTLVLHAYRILPNGEMLRGRRVIQVNRIGDLTISAKLDKKTYRPGEKAIINFLIKNRNGDPTQAALSLAAVDEAVFALSELRPGFERVYFALQEELLKPRYEIHGHVPRDLYVQAGDDQLAEVDRRGAMLAAADGGQGPQKEVGETFGQRNSRIAQEQHNHKENLAATFFVSPYAAFVLLLLPVFAYAGIRFIRPQRGSSEEACQQFRKACRWLIVFWVLGFYVPFLTGLLGAGIGAGIREVFHARRWIIGFFFCSGAGLGFICFAVLNFLKAGKLRALQLTQEFPNWRKLTFILPTAYLLAGASVLFLILGAINDAIDEDLGVPLFLVLPLLIGLAAGAIAVAGRAVADDVSRWRLSWTFVSRAALILLPLLLLAGTMPVLSSAKRADMAGNAMPMAAAEAFDLVDGMERTVLKTGAAPAKTEEPDTATGKKLKAPSRIRRYFPETLLWKPELITDAKGEAKLHLPLADSITTWRLAMSAVSKGGELGSGTTGIRVFQDFFIDIDFPVALTQNDRVSVPVSLFNYLKTDQTVRLEVQPATWCKLLDEPKKTLILKPGEVRSVYFTLVAEKPGRHALQIKAFGSQMADAVERRVNVRPDGEEIVQTVNGALAENLSQEITIPAAAIDEASDLYVKIYPGAFSQVMEGLDGILRMPYGCFEQTSSSTYPNVIVLDYMRKTKQIKPEVEMKALQYINTGYQRLLSFEVKGGGFDWFGNPPAHNILTAYGLLEFNDMAKVYEVDPKVIARTREWLMKQQKGDGSWAPTSGGIAEGAINRQRDDLTATAYIAWALAEAGERSSDLNKAFDYLISRRDKMANYTLALTCSALVHAEHSEAKSFLQELVKRKTEKDKLVWWTSDGKGATHSMGDTLSIETTGIAACALLKGGHERGTAHKALAWLVQKKDSYGTWHSTQATIFGIKALIAGTGEGGPATDKDLQVTVSANGKLAQEIKITPETSDVYRLISLRSMVKEGTNKISLETSGKGNLAYQIVAKHYMPWPKDKVGKPGEVLSIDVTYDSTKTTVDNTLTCNVKLQYNRPGTAQMTLVDLGIPPGFKIETDAFDEMKQNKVIEKYTVTGRQVILYFREIKGQEPLLFSYKLKAKFPVKAKTPVSAAYQYYEPEIRAEAKPAVLTVE